MLLCTILLFFSYRVDTDPDLGGTFLYLPLVCNVEVVDDPKEDTFVIALKLHILNLEELRASDMNNHLFITHRETFSDKDTFLDRFNTKTSVIAYFYKI
jgi:hypothetical protein